MTEQPLIAVLDYGIGNLRSAQKALQRCGADARLTVDHGLIADADAVVLPGVGAFGACMAALRDADLEDVVEESVDSGRPFMGICVGMQMLFDASEDRLVAMGFYRTGLTDFLTLGMRGEGSRERLHSEGQAVEDGSYEKTLEGKHQRMARQHLPPAP